MERQPNLLFSVPLRGWQEFQNTLAHSTGVAMCLFDIEGSPFSSYSWPPEECLSTLQSGEVLEPSCLEFYRGLFDSLQDRTCFTSCPYGCKLFVFQISTYVQRVGYLVIAFPPETDVQKQNVALEAKARDIYRMVNGVLLSLIEKNLLGLRRLELNSIYEISRFLVSTVELDKVLELITDSIVILYDVELCFLGLRKEDRVEVVQAKGPLSNLVLGSRWLLTEEFIEKIFSGIELSYFSCEELETLLNKKVTDVGNGMHCFVYPLLGGLGVVGLLGILLSSQLGKDAMRNLQIYANFAAVALANALLVRRLEEESRTDFLTGLSNRKALLEILNLEITRSTRYGSPFTVVFFDLDNFKEYNDDFGHLTGDVVLQRIAQIVRGSIREVDLLARYGGEEFVIVLPGTDERGAFELAERLREKIALQPLPHRRLTASFGVVSLREGDTPTSLLERADQACYEAKRRGKNCTFVT